MLENAHINPLNASDIMEGITGTSVPYTNLRRKFVRRVKKYQIKQSQIVANAIIAVVVSSGLGGGWAGR